MGHEVETKWVAPAGVAVLAAFFFTVMLIGFLRPRLVLPVLAIWLAASLFFGFFSSSAIAGLSLFDPLVSIKAPDAFADEVARHRTVVVPPGTEDSDGSGSGNPSSGPNDLPGDGAQNDLVGGIAEDAPGEVLEEAVIARLEGAGDPADRADAAQQLAEFGSAEALEALAHARLYDSSQLVREKATDAITEWSFEALVELLQEHPEAIVRRAAAAALGRLGDARAVEPLATALLTDETAEVRQESANALRQLDDPEAVSPLIQALLQDRDSSVRAEAAAALGALEDERAVQALLETLQDDYSSLAREAGATALGRIRGSSPLAELDAARMDDLSASVREEAALALRRYTTAELIDALHNATQAEDRAVAAKLLGEERKSIAIPELILALGDSGRNVRKEASSGLDNFGHRQELENGNSLLTQGRDTYVLPGTTTSQSSGLSHVPLFRFTNQARLDFLRTSVGDVYTGDGWLDTNIKALPYAAGETIEQIDASGSPLTRISSMRGYTVYYEPPSGEAYLPGGILPIGYVPHDAQVDGVYRPGSSTFLMRQRRSYATANVTPARYDESILRTAVPELWLTIPLPNSIPDRVRELAVRITAGHTSAYDKAKAIEQYLASNYTYRLADETTMPIPAGQDHVDWFLFESREGTCGQFSSAFAVLAQSIGLRARVVSGFAITPGKDEQIVFADQAHQRAEIAFDGLGWVAFEPTPDGEGAPDRASEYLASGQSTPRSAEAEIQRLAEQLSSDDPDKVENAQRALEEQGASVHTLENGGRVVGLGAFTLATPPGTTADQAYGLLKLPVFTVTGAQETGYLQTATGTSIPAMDGVNWIRWPLPTAGLNPFLIWFVIHSKMAGNHGAICRHLE